MSGANSHNWTKNVDLILLRAANPALQGRVKARRWVSILCLTMAIGALPQEAAK
jgi:hypothetical protein